MLEISAAQTNPPYDAPSASGLPRLSGAQANGGRPGLNAARSSSGRVADRNKQKDDDGAQEAQSRNNTFELAGAGNHGHRGKQDRSDTIRKPRCCMAAELVPPCSTMKLM